MIELRWVERQELVIHKHKEQATVKTVKVLQVRKIEHVVPIYTGLSTQRWSPWKDVPTVREEDESK